MQDTDLGCYDVCFDGDLRAGAAAVRDLPVEILELSRRSLSDDSRQRNRAWVAWWAVCAQAEQAGRTDLVRFHAPTERPGRAAHAQHVRACTTRLQRALAAVDQTHGRTPTRTDA